MAKIEMDISEYEALKENKKLLQDALDREKELGNKLNTLKEEEIQALEDAQQKIVVVHEKRSYQSTYQVKSKEDIFNSLQRGTSWQSGVETCFNITEHETPSVKTITTKGLEEVEELIKQELSKTYQDKISKLESLKEELQSSRENLIKEKVKLEKDNKELKVAVSNWKEQYQELIVYRSKAIETFIQINNLISHLGLFNYKSIRKYIKELINKIHVI